MRAGGPGVRVPLFAWLPLVCRVLERSESKVEVISVYWKLSPPTLSMKESTRVCNALALFQVMAKNPETRKELIEAKIPCYFYPFLKPSGDDKPLEYLRLTSLGVLGALAKFDDPYGPKVLHFFLETEVVPSCLECIDLCDELSRKVATLIVMKILMQEKGMSYCSATPERFYSIVQVLYRVVQKLTEKPCLLHLMMTTKRHGCCRCCISMFMDLYFPLNEDSINYEEYCNAEHNNFKD
uniref:Cell differentiation protein rcd1 n=1 Tax=Solanum tuberosum TaxID=4113 RepID=M1BFL4_SOLTU